MNSNLPNVKYVYFSSQLYYDSNELTEFGRENIVKEYLNNPSFLKEFKVKKRFNSGAVIFERVIDNRARS